jgi:cytochrome c biogenesis factor
LAGSTVDALVVALLPKILNITVPQVGHLPLIARRPFFIVSSTPLMISFLALHLTQYPSGIEKNDASALHALKQNQE